jgi:transcriptional regulator with XRE-family HTH domain
LITVIEPPPQANRVALALAVAKARNDAELTLDQLAERSGVSRRMLVEIEHGRINPSAYLLHAIAHATNSHFGELILALCDGHPPPG